MDTLMKPSSDFIRWFAGSRVVTPAGEPLTAYRGEHGATEDGGLQSLLGNFTFTSCPRVASTYAMSPNNQVRHRVAEQPRVVPAVLSMKNPIFEQPDDPFAELGDIAQKLGGAFAKRMAIKHDEHVMNTSNWEEVGRGYGNVKAYLDANPDGLDNLYLMAYPLLDDPEFVDAARAAGYDGAIHIGNGESASEMEYRVFDISQVRSALGDRASFAPVRDIANAGVEIDSGRRFAAAQAALEWMEVEKNIKITTLGIEFRDRHASSASFL